jgi:hypothetical protein
VPARLCGAIRRAVERPLRLELEQMLTGVSTRRLVRTPEPVGEPPGRVSEPDDVDMRRP